MRPVIALPAAGTHPPGYTELMSPKSKGSGKKTATKKPAKRPSSTKGASSKGRPSAAKRSASTAKTTRKAPSKGAKARKPASSKPARKRPAKKPLAPKTAAKPKSAAAKPSPAKPAPTKRAAERPAPAAPKTAPKPQASIPKPPPKAPPRPAPPKRPSPAEIEDDYEDDVLPSRASVHPPAVVSRPTEPPAPRVPLPRPKGGKPLVGPPPPGPRAMGARPYVPEPLWDAIPLPDEKSQLRRYYQGAQMPSPMGGFLEPLRVRSEDDGSGTVIFECSASSLRFALAVPAATRAEKKAIKDAQDAGEDPVCPRHEPTLKLNRVGQALICPLCGVRYGKI